LPFKLEVESADLRDSGREFQTVRPATQRKLSSPPSLPLNFVFVHRTM